MNALAFSQGTETFTNIPASASSYATRTWVGDNNQTWAATDARTDQSLTGKAITLRVGKLSCNTITNGISSVTFSYKYVFTGATGNLVLKINGAQVGNAVTVPSSQTTAQTVSFNNLSYTGTCTFEIEQTVAGGPRIVIDDISWNNNNTTPCVVPSAQPTSLTFGTVTNNTINASFSLAANMPDEYIVFISTNNSMGSLPINGTAYATDDVLNNATVVYKGAVNSFTAQGLQPGTNYYFFVYALNSACANGPLYLTANPLTANISTTSPPVCTVPVGNVSNLQLTPTNNTINGSYTTSPDADGYLIIRSTNPVLNFTPTNNTSYAIGQIVGNGIVIKNTAGSTLNTTGLITNTLYYFTVFSFNGTSCVGGPLYNTNAVTASITTTNSANNNGEPTNYYAATNGKGCADLKTTLKAIITTGHNAQSYGDLYNQYALTDIKPREVGTGSANVIWDIYSDRPTATDPYNYDPFTQRCGNYAVEGDCFNREHSVPQSWFNQAAPAVSDYHHIFPTDGKVNGIRSNYVFGNVASATTTSLNGSKLGTSADAGINTTVFEPINAYKGDVARAFLYFVTRYENNIASWSSNGNAAFAFDNNTFPGVKLSYLRLMIEWNNQDPVSQKEIDRNNGGYIFQGNRNPYVDRPEFVSQVWNNTCAGLSGLVLPVTLEYFRGKLLGNILGLTWKAAYEVNFDKYEVQRSVNGTYYNTIATVKGTNTAYTFEDNIDKYRGSRVFYRLKMIDKDGTIKYSDVFTIHLPLNTRFSVSPNPVVTNMQVQLYGNVHGGVLQLIHATGAIITKKQIANGIAATSISVGGIAPGLYTVRFIEHNKIIHQQKVMIVN